MWILPRFERSYQADDGLGVRIRILAAMLQAISRAVRSWIG